mgnify:FL=1
MLSPSSRGKGLDFFLVLLLFQQLVELVVQFLSFQATSYDLAILQDDDIWHGGHC